MSTLPTWKLCIHVGKGAATVNGKLERARHNDEAWIFDEDSSNTCISESLLVQGPLWSDLLSVPYGDILSA